MDGVRYRVVGRYTYKEACTEFVQGSIKLILDSGISGPTDSKIYL